MLLVEGCRWKEQEEDVDKKYKSVGMRIWVWNVQHKDSNHNMDSIKASIKEVVTAIKAGEENKDSNQSRRGEQGQQSKQERRTRTAIKAGEENKDSIKAGEEYKDSIKAGEQN
eukprot:Selendium_serpulae@DN6470_c2_g1_i8.p2